MGRVVFCLLPSGALRLVVWLDGIECLVSVGLLTSLDFTSTLLEHHQVSTRS